MKRSTFIDFYSDTDAEDPEYIDRYFRERGIDIQKAREEILNRAREIAAQQKIEEGKRFKSTLYERMKQKLSNTPGASRRDSMQPAAAVSYRKLDMKKAGDEKESADDMEKLDMIRQVKDSLSKGGNHE